MKPFFDKDFLKIRAQENNFEKTQGSKAVNMIYLFNCKLSVIYKKTVVSLTESIRLKRFTNIGVLFSVRVFWVINDHFTGQFQIKIRVIS